MTSTGTDTSLKAGHTIPNGMASRQPVLPSSNGVGRRRKRRFRHAAAIQIFLSNAGGSFVVAMYTLPNTSSFGVLATA